MNPSLRMLWIPRAWFSKDRIPRTKKKWHVLDFKRVRILAPAHIDGQTRNRMIQDSIWDQHSITSPTTCVRIHATFFSPLKPIYWVLWTWTVLSCEHRFAVVYDRIFCFCFWFLPNPLDSVKIRFLPNPSNIWPNLK